MVAPAYAEASRTHVGTPVVALANGLGRPSRPAGRPGVATVGNAGLAIAFVVVGVVASRVGRTSDATGFGTIDGAGRGHAFVAFVHAGHARRVGHGRRLVGRVGARSPRPFVGEAYPAQAAIDGHVATPCPAW